MVVRAKVNDAARPRTSSSTPARKAPSSPVRPRNGSASRRITYTLSAGVGSAGLRGIQLARIDTLELGQLKLRNMPCLIKDPPMRDMPMKETEGYRRWRSATR